MKTEFRDAQDRDVAVRENRSIASGFYREDKDGETRYTFPISSEEPYRRWRGDEVLIHSKAAVDLSFLNSGTAPLLFGHDSHRGQVGVIEKAWLDAKKKRVYVTARFSKRQTAQEVKQDIDDGIMRNVSVGYDVLETEWKESEGDVKKYDVTSWKPMEASIVSIPADATVGVGRAEQQRKDGIMPDTEVTGGMPTAPAKPVVKPDENVRSEAEIAAEIQARNVEILDLAASHNKRDFAEKCIRKGVSVEQFRGLLLSELETGTPLVNQDIGLQEKEAERFSFVRLARTMADNATSAEIKDARFELEACEAAAKSTEAETRGHRVPTDVMRNFGNFRIGDENSREIRESRAAMSTGVQTQVQDTDHLASRFIDTLRNASSILQAGVTVLDGLSGNVEIPGGNANAVAAWLAAEDDDAAETVPTFRLVTLAIKDLAGYTDLTRRMMMQSTISVEAYVRMQLAKAIVEGIDLGGLQGSGLSGVPTGLKNTAGIGSVTFAAANPTWGEIVDLETEVADANALFGNTGYIGTTNMRGYFKKTAKDPGSGIYLMANNNDGLNGHPYVPSNQVTSGDLFFGNWSDMLMGMWGGLDLDRDMAAKFLSGGVRLRAIQSVDFGVAHVESFALGNDGV